MSTVALYPEAMFRSPGRIPVFCLPSITAYEMYSLLKICKNEDPGMGGRKVVDWSPPVGVLEFFQVSMRCFGREMIFQADPSGAVTAGSTS
jgi:hypothetical protein